jgi:hypothetical protein
MPNYCGNTLTITHEDPEMIRRAKAAFAEGEFLNEFVPVPKDLQITAGKLGDPVAQAELELKEQANLARHGYKTWYDFCINEWGTKWDVGNGAGIQTWDDHELVVYFDSAWSPPIAAYERLLDLGFTVYATYYEPGCAFAGVWDNGYDDHYNLSDMSSQDVIDGLPEELDEAYGISESMAEWEAENQDEVTTWYKDGVEETGLTPHVIKKEK